MQLSLSVRPLRRKLVGASELKIPRNKLDSLFKKYPSNPSIVISKYSHLFHNHTSVYNSRCSARPVVAFAPNSYKQAQEVFKLLKKYNQTFAILSGGHEYDCGSTSKGAVISMRNFKKIKINRSTKQAIVGSGVRSGELL